MKTNVIIDFLGLPLSVSVDLYDDGDMDIGACTTLDHNGIEIDEIDLYLNERGHSAIYDLVADALNSDEIDLIEPDDPIPLHFGDEGIYR
tara:strand:- start:65 stop:334 length:270 start_codon:yes stop_codon:yes gene_type:complete